MMKRILFVSYLLGRLLFLLPDCLWAQGDGNLVAVELTGAGNSFTNAVFDYRESEIRNQLCIPPEVLCLPVGTQIHALSIPYRIRIYDGSALTQSLGNMRIALGESQSMPSGYYSYIEEGMNTLYEGDDQLEVTLTDQIQFVTYNLSAPFTYKGGYLLVDLKTTTADPITQNINISTSFHEFGSILCLYGENGNQPHKESRKPDLVLGVITPSGQAVPYIPLQFRESILGYAPVGGSSPEVDIPITNIGDQPLTIEGLSSAAFQIISRSNEKTIAPSSITKYGISFAPSSAGTYEERVQLQTSAGTIAMDLSGTTYRQAPYNREIQVSPNNHLHEQISPNEAEQITELSVSGQIDNSDIAYLCNQMPSLTRLDLSAALYPDGNFRFEGSFLQLEQLALPTGITKLLIPQSAQLTKLILPMGFKILGKDNEASMPPNLNTLIAFSNNPTTAWMNGKAEEILQYIQTVYVPENAVKDWKNAGHWDEKNILPITDAVLQPGFGGNVMIQDERIFTADNYPIGEVGISIKPDEGQETASAALTNQAPVQIKELSLSYRLNDRRKGYNEPLPDGLFVEKGAYSSFINEHEEATLQSVSYQLKLQPSKWHFISFPFDVDRSAFISASENGSKEYVIRRYDGQSRANNGMNSSINWKDETERLSAGNGYILQTDYLEYNNDTYNLSLYIENEDAIKSLLNTQAVSIPLRSYSSGYEDNKNWNLIGNPYPAYYNIGDIDFGSASIIVIWDGQGYIPLSIRDDSYSLRPLEAFFVQKPDDQDVITFVPGGRRSNAESTDFYALRSASNPVRKVLNLTLSGDTYTDRARIVINPSARPGFDMNNDAIKWMSSDKEIPQFYTIGDDGKQYAINERPAGTGCIPVGFYVGQTGTYAFRMSPKQDWEQVLLIDKYENKQIDLCRTDYSFHADRGTVDDRFEIRLGSDIPTSNLPVEAASGSVRAEGHTLYIRVEEKADVTVYSVSGIEKYHNRIEAGSTTLRLESGFYLVRINETTHKVIIR